MNELMEFHWNNESIIKVPFPLWFRYVTSKTGWYAKSLKFSTNLATYHKGVGQGYIWEKKKPQTLAYLHN